jgi:site-specific DNA-cytosine methylase
MPVCRKRPAAADPCLPLLGSRAPFTHAMRCRGGLRVATDFSGMETPIYVLHLLNIVFTHVFSCDTSTASQKIARHLQAEHIYTDILQRDIESTPAVDLYIFGPPCQAFSRSGLRQGLEDPNGQLTLHSLLYIGAKRPPMIVMEQVPQVKSEHEGLWKFIIQTLTGFGYKLKELLLNAVHFGLPQRRVRMYLVGTLVKTVEFPMPSREQVTMAAVVTPLPTAAFCMMPTLELHGARCVQIVVQHLEKQVARGIDVFNNPVIIETGASVGRAKSSVDIAMTITKSEAGRRGYWCTTKGGHLEPDEVALLQGIPRDMVPWREIGISPSQYGQLVGNAMSLPILMCLLPHVLLAAGKVTEDECVQLCSRAQAFDPFA